MNPIFSLDEKVFHINKGKWGKVVDIFPGFGGTAYYVQHSGFVWSVPEAGLDSSDIDFRPSQNQALTEQKISKRRATKKAA